ncbi:MAG TPA: DUF4041 domain-containing protein [Kofleriaceae bacterium]|jgi:hypothetical protein|nr:DUF4041 domain-containing protein [Kofleriaceae bacterium]
MTIAVVGLAAGLCAAGVLLVLTLIRFSAQRRRFAAIVDVDVEVRRLRTHAEEDASRLRQLASDDAARVRAQTDALQRTAARDVEVAQQSLEAARAEQARIADDTTRLGVDHDRLAEELRKVEGSLDDISFGVYKPQYKFDTTEQFKHEMDRVYDKQKELVRAGKAATFAVSWTINNNKKEGERMQKQYCKLLLRAFNGECDASIAKVSWNNATKMEERIRKAFDAINQLGEVMTVSLSAPYRELKLAELRLEYELTEKKHEIAEEQRALRDRMRDEQKAMQEAERAQHEAEADEVRFQKALEKAKLELGKARGEEHARLTDKMLLLQQELAEAQAKSTRAKSLAEMTRRGYVYIISNVGSFGEEVFKIGMTRRLEPMERVRELSAASVPFPFDVHAMVYNDDAPALEAAFHQRFRDRSVNLVNSRKEFFNVNIAELEAFAKERGLRMDFTKLAEAREYRESVSMRLAKGSGPTKAQMPPVDALEMRTTLGRFGAVPARESNDVGARVSR